MVALRTGAFVLFALFMPVCCSDSCAGEETTVPEVFFTDPVICYFLDAFLMVYCITVTALFFREKFSKMPTVTPVPEEKGRIYQELERPKDADPYQELKPRKAKAKTDRKKRAKKNQANPKDREPYESVPISPPPASSP